VSLPTPDAVYTNSRTTSGSLSVTTGAHAVGKRIIVATVRSDAAGNTGGLTVTDTRGNTYTRDAISLRSGIAEVAIFSTVLTTALQAGDTITAAWNASSQNRFLMAAHVYTDLTGGKDASSNNTVTSNPTDSGPSAGSGVAVSGSTTGATTSADGMTFAVVSSTNNAGGISAGSGFTALGPNLVTAAGSSDRRLFTEAKNTVATGTQTATATLDVSAAWVAAVAHYPGTVPNTAPTANAGADQSAAAGATVTLTGSDSDAEANISTRMWDHTGGAVTTFSETWTGTDGAAWPAGWSSAGAGSATIQTNQGKLTSGATGYSPIRTLRGLNLVDSDRTLKFTPPATGEAYLAVGARVDQITTPLTANSSLPKNGYVVIFATDSAGKIATVEINRCAADVRTVLQAATAVTLGAGPYKTRIKLTGGRIRVKIWVASGSEPAAWNFDLTDGTPYTTSGGTFICGLNGSVGTVRDWLVDDLTVDELIPLTGSGASRTLTVPSVASGTAFTFTYTVTDTGGLSASDTMTLTVNTPPTANAGADQTGKHAGDTITLTGSDSDADGTISSRSWTQVGGSPTVTLSGSGNTRTFTAPSTAGGTTLTFRYSVTDNAGATTTDDMTVTVLANANPVANAGPDQANRIPGTKVTLTGTDSDTDGTVASRSWSQISGTAVTLAGSGATRTFDAPAGPATLVFRYSVTDNGGATSTDDVSIGVIAAATIPDGLHEFVVNGDGTKSLMTHKVV
jgi:hypothetical protein